MQKIVQQWKKNTSSCSGLKSDPNMSSSFPFSPQNQTIFGIEGCLMMDKKSKLQLGFLIFFPKPKNS
jgi:hypothetical protein